MTRFALIENKLCVSVRGFVEAYPGREKAALSTIKMGFYRARNGSQYYQYHVDVVDNRKRWIVLDSLPDMIYRRLTHYYGDDLWSAYNKELLEGEVERRYTDEDIEFFIGHRLPNDKAIDLGRSCGWMRLSASDYWQGRWDGRMDFYGAVVEVLSPLNLYGMRVSHVASLRRKIRDWNKLGRESLLHGNTGNTHRAFDNPAQTRIVDLYISPLKPSMRRVWEMYLREATDKGWKEYTYQRIVQILNAPEIRQIAITARHGEAAARQLTERSVKRSRPSFADALWVVDGTTVQLIHLDDKGKVASELYIVAVTDAHSRDVVGYSVGATETGALVQAALRDAVRRSGHAPAQLQYDNSSANKSAEAQSLFQKITKLAFPTAPYNGKSKIIEALYGHIEQDFLRHFPNFKGGNITAKSLASRANPDLIRELIAQKQVPTRAQALAQLRLAIETYRNTVVKMSGQTPREMYATPHPERKPLGYLTMITLLWVERTHMATYTKDGITIEVQGQRYTYEVEKSKGVEDLDWRIQHLGQRFKVMYDPDEVSSIALFTADWRYVATANRKWEAPMAKADSQPGDGEIIADALADRQEYLDRLRRRAKEIREDMEVKGFPVVDFQLLHKDAFNRMEQAELDKLLEETGRVVAYENTPPRRRRKSLYEDESADGSLITD